MDRNEEISDIADDLECITEGLVGVSKDFYSNSHEIEQMRELVIRLRKVVNQREKKGEKHIVTFRVNLPSSISTSGEMQVPLQTVMYYIENTMKFAVVALEVATGEKALLKKEN